MKKKGLWIYVAVFALLTLMTWSPLGYGDYGQPERVFGIPSWAVVALLAGLVLFVLEWVFLFASGLALDDEELEKTVSILKDVPEDAEGDSVSERKVVKS